MRGTRGTETSKYPEEEKETIDFLSSGERKGKSPNRNACIPGFGLHKVLKEDSGTVWEVRPERVKGPYTKSESSRQHPEYHGTRETLWEGAETTP